MFMLSKAEKKFHGKYQIDRLIGIFFHTPKLKYENIVRNTDYIWDIQILPDKSQPKS